MRSSVVPHTIASETAQKTNWKNHFASIVALEMPITGNAWSASPPWPKSRRKNPPSWPMKLPTGPPKANAKPDRPVTRAPAIEKFVKILATTVPAFLPREKPISRNAKPACMNITKQAATTSQSVLIAADCGKGPRVPSWRIVSASALAGTMSAAKTPSGTARTSILRVMRPPGIGCGGEFGAAVRAGL